MLEDQGYLNDGLNTAPADVLVLPMTEDLSPAIALATQLRQSGIRVQIHAEQKKFKQKISYADKLRIPYVIFLGEDEINQPCGRRQGPDHRRAGEAVPRRGRGPHPGGAGQAQPGCAILDKGE